MAKTKSYHGPLDWIIALRMHLLDFATCFARPVFAGAISAWNPKPLAPQIVMQDDDTGKIVYSRCDSNVSTVFDPENPLSLDIASKYSPQRGSSLAGLGWWTEEGSQATVHYLDTKGRIIHSLWKCDGNGHFRAVGMWVISDVCPSVRMNTPLAAINLDNDKNYRVYYQDKDNAVCSLSYSRKQGEWRYDGVISNSTTSGKALGAAWMTHEDIMVGSPRGSREIRISRLQNNVTWNMSSLPDSASNTSFPSDISTTVTSLQMNSTTSSFATNTPTANPHWQLPAWDGNVANLGHTVNTAKLSSIFYIGTDARLHLVTERENGTWAIGPEQLLPIWLKADRPNSSFGTTYSNSTGEVWIYYVSGGNMIEAYRSSDMKWRDARVLGKGNDTIMDTSSNGGLLAGARIGLGIGIGLGVIAIIGLGIFVFCLRRHRLAHAKDQEQATQKSIASPATTMTKPSPEQYKNMITTGQDHTSGDDQNLGQGAWINGEWVPAREAELSTRISDMGYVQPDPVYEMENPVYSHELMSGGNCVEMSTEGTPELRGSGKPGPAGGEAEKLPEIQKLTV